MPLFPRIDSPCPYKASLDAVMDGDFCRMCRRNVVDLTAFSDSERLAFLAGCEEQVCVSYRIPRAAVGAAALAAATMALPTAAAAQDVPAVQEVQAVAPTEAVVDTASPEEDMYIMLGGILDPKQAQFSAVGEDEAGPELPVVYEEDGAAAAKNRTPEPTNSDGA